MRRKHTFNELLRDITLLHRQLSESYGFDDERDMRYGMDDDDMEYGREGEEGGRQMLYDDEQDDMEQPQKMGQKFDDSKDESEEEKAMHVQEVIKHEPIIAKIRETAIEGLRKYSEDPTSPIYDFFKKVFLLADKTITDDGSKK